MSTGRDLLGSVISSCCVGHVNTASSRCISRMHHLLSFRCRLKQMVPPQDTERSGMFMSHAAADGRLKFSSKA